MIKSLLPILIICIMGSDKVQAQEVNANYDSILAKSLNADEYGMKNYFFVILKSGTNKSSDQTAIDSAFSGHLKNINRLAEEGTLVLAGPFGENDNNYRGLFVINAKDLTEAEEIISSDPAVQAKFLEAEFYPWYGSASLQELIKIHDKIAKYKF